MTDHLNFMPRDGIMTITSAIAADWLEHRNKGNRHISAAIVKQYAKAMTEGRWMITHQGIAFDEEGLLLDGQHRLSAVVASKATIQAQISTGVPRETFTVLDTGRRRQANQLIDHPFRIIIAAAARIVGYLDGIIPASKDVYGYIIPSKVDNDIVLQVWEQWPEMGMYAGSVDGVRKAAHIQASAHLAVATQAARSDHAPMLESWFEGLRTGAGLAEHDPRLLLRNRFIQGEDVRGSGSMRMARSYQLIVKAWNAHATGAPVRQLKILPDQRPPKVIGARLGERR